MQQAEDKKSINRIGLIFLILGRIAAFIGCGMFIGFIALDHFGAETNGNMVNISYDSVRSDNPFPPRSPSRLPAAKKILLSPGRTDFTLNLMKAFNEKVKEDLTA
ncbi:MAG: hypothetical protein HXY38_13570 [Chloroflexi bacterium]|nr:hypothetical protein [Chloroflexota bacterium]